MRVSALSEEGFLYKMARAGFVAVEVLTRDNLSIDDCALYPLFPTDVISLMRLLILRAGNDAVAVSVVIRAALPPRQVIAQSSG